MNRCKNCGSTAQFKLVLTEYLTNSLLETYECCGCGYTETDYYTFEGASGRTADGTIIYNERNNRE